MNRRQFCGNAMVAGLAVLFPAFRAFPKTSADDDRAFQKLIAAMDEQGARHGDAIHREQVENLAYAIRQIRPAGHQEFSFVVACGFHCRSTSDRADEYVRRRRGEKPLLPDHHLFALDDWCMPETRRIIIYKEQRAALMSELTGRLRVSSERLCNLIRRGEIGYENFAGMLQEKHKEALSDDDKKMIYEMFRAEGRFVPYIWCSTIVARADVL